MSGATPDKPEQQPVARKGRRFSADTLNLVIAVCAVLISAASFVATYVQSDAALRQVKAETWPFLQVENGNFDEEDGERTIYYQIDNVGVGPARVINFSVSYEGKTVSSLWDLVKTCCALEEPLPNAGLSATTNSAAPVILPTGGSVRLFDVPAETSNSALWALLDKARHKLKASACYCSLLGDCFETDFDAEPTEVGSCERKPEEDFVG